MSNNEGSEAFEIFAECKCQEILQSNDGHRELDKKIIGLENRLFSMVNEQTIKLYLEIDSLKELQSAQDNSLIFRTAYQ